MKKLLMGILALTLALSFTACGDDSKKDSDKEETTQTEVEKDNKKDKTGDEKDEKADPEEAAEETVVKFMDAFCKFDFKEMEKYIDGELPEEISEMNFNAVKEEAIGELPEEMSAYKPQLEKMFDNAIDEMLATISYDIKDVKEDGDDIAVTVEIKMADFNSLEDVLNDAMSADLEEKFMEIAQEAIESGALTEDSTEQEAMDYIMPKAFDMIGDILSDEIKKLDKVTEEGKFIVSEVDGEWLINADKSEL